MINIALPVATPLFHRRIFGATAICPAHLVHTGDEILEKCCYAPLAIALLSGLLANKPRSTPVWKGVQKCVAATDDIANFVTLLVDCKLRRSPLHDKVRRLSVIRVNDGDHGFLKSMATLNFAHYMFFGGVMPKLRFKRLVLLRVMDLEGCKDLTNRDVEEIASRLMHLRYLSVKDTPISELPDQIGQLQHLETLDLRDT
ncbi:hypothetical protein PR202_ga22481 [Eleusine coracana subsp. coracana]|uniref:Disease resistance R13L4/SHOC-2-like LRR domain-containing protein n=1 Tax=Eleusine coracana subsp. coracana TaxID=191504 RepID=A0AAV5D4C7_ELECO|nr:hypothetical protein PR202_ga22481 [Eleusine coracana subsp. coracana]